MREICYENLEEKYPKENKAVIERVEYELSVIKKTGFSNIEIKTRKEIRIPDDVMKAYLKEEQMASFERSEVGIFSITVVGYK